MDNLEHEMKGKKGRQYDELQNKLRIVEKLRRFGRGKLQNDGSDTFIENLTLCAPRLKTWRFEAKGSEPC